MAREVHYASCCIGLCFSSRFIFLFENNFYIENASHFGGLIEQTDANQFMRSFFVVASLFVTLISGQFLSRNSYRKQNIYT